MVLTHVSFAGIARYFKAVATMHSDGEETRTIR